MNQFLTANRDIWKFFESQIFFSFYLLDENEKASLELESNGMCRSEEKWKFLRRR